MASRRRRFLWISVGILSVPAILLATLLIYWTAAFYPSKIVAFHPQQFPAETGAPFFYSIGNQLKNGTWIDPVSRTLVWGTVSNFLVSPDQSRIAIVANEHLLVVNRDGTLWRDITPVDTIYRDPEPIGKTFFRDDDFQWTRDSSAIYLIKDQYYQSKGSQLFSEKGELWKYDIPSGKLQIVLKPFPAYNYFFDRDGGIYFSVPTKQGDLRLRYFDGKSTKDVGQPGAARFPVCNADSNCIHDPFYSFSSFDYESMVLAGSGLAVSDNDKTGVQTITFRGNPLLQFTRGEGLKGAYYCSEEGRSVYLPGDRFLVFDAPYCDNYNGELLIDLSTGKYETLPSDTRVYRTVNSSSNPYFVVTSGGISAR